MRGSNYTAEQSAFIMENFNKTNSARELAEIFNKRFCEKRTAGSIKRKCQRLGLKREITSMFTPEINEWLKQSWEKYTSSQLAKLIEDNFGIAPKTQTVTDQLIRLGISRGTCYHAKNYIAPGSKPIGSERVEKGRNIMVKVAEPDVWKPKAIIVAGYDSKVSQAIFLDGNPLNCTRENILVVSRGVHARLAQNGWLGRGENVLRAGIAWSELLYALKKME